MTPKHFDSLISKSKAMTTWLVMAKENEDVRDDLINSVIETLDKMEEIITTHW